MWLNESGLVVEAVEVGLDHGNCSGLLAVRPRVDEDGEAVAILKRVSEIEAANSEVDHAYAVRRRANEQAACDFHSEAVIAEEDIADAGDENRWLLRECFDALCPGRRCGNRFHFGGSEEEPVAWLAHHAEVAARVLVEDHADVLRALVVFLDALNDRHLVPECKIEDVAALPGMQANAISGPQLDPAGLRVARRSLVLEEAPFPFVHASPSFTTVRPRSTP